MLMAFDVLPSLGTTTPLNATRVSLCPILVHHSYPLLHEYVLAVPFPWNILSFFLLASPLSLQTNPA